MAVSKGMIVEVTRSVQLALKVPTPVSAYPVDLLAKPTETAYKCLVLNPGILFRVYAIKDTFAELEPLDKTMIAQLAYYGKSHVIVDIASLSVNKNASALF